MKPQRIELQIDSATMKKLKKFTDDATTVHNNKGFILQVLSDGKAFGYYLPEKESAQVKRFFNDLFG